MSEPVNGKRNQGSRMTPNLFACIKRLLESGASKREISDYLQVGSNTISRVRDAETYEEYKVITYERTKAAKAAKAEKVKDKSKGNSADEKPAAAESPVQVVEHRQSVTIQATHYMMEELKKTNELLTAISAKLAYVVEQLS